MSRHRAPHVIFDRSLVVLLLCVVAACGGGGSTERVETTVSGAFTVRSYVGKCLTYGDPSATSPDSVPAGSPVYIADCMGPDQAQGPYQNIVVREINDPDHPRAVILMAGDKAIGVTAGFLIAGVQLVLQDYVEGSAVRAQVFVLDGDSIILEADRNLVVEVRHGRGATGAPLALATRAFADSEFWTFEPRGGGSAQPTSGFVGVSNHADLVRELATATRGSVIQVDADADIDCSAHIHNLGPLRIPEGVTLRGDRRGTRFGPQLYADFVGESAIVGSMLEIAGNDVRITGLRLRGPTRDPNAKVGYFHGIIMDNKEYTAIVDHNDISDWPVGGVAIGGVQFTRDCELDDNGQHPPRIDPQLRQLQMRVVRNFIHNQRNDLGGGYGVVVGNGGYASIDSNTFLDNRHSIAGDGTTHNGYSAWFNLVLSRATSFNGNYQQDFDMHGSNGGYGFPAGTGIEVVSNTFLGDNRDNLFLRGPPCGGADLFANNVVRNDQDSAIKWRDTGSDSHHYPDDYPYWLDVPPGNRFGAEDPTGRLAVGDFDGDGVEDTFLATGAAWYFAPAGNAEWRYLGPKTEGIDALRFGDFDGDGRTDVLGSVDGELVVSWGGSSRWETINTYNVSIEDIAVGDFNGDHHADIFHANGDQWFVAYSGTGPFGTYAGSSYRVEDLRFGDFDGDGKTEVFGIVAEQWMVVYGGTATWAPLRSALIASVANLVVADFTGDGLADVATSVPSDGVFIWAISNAGQGDWETLGASSTPLNAAAGIGYFDDADGADVLIWNGRVFDIASGGSGDPTRQSRQDMR